MANHALQTTIQQGWFDAAEDDWKDMALVSRQLRKAGGAIHHGRTPEIKGQDKPGGVSHSAQGGYHDPESQNEEKDPTMEKHKEAGHTPKDYDHQENT